MGAPVAGFEMASQDSSRLAGFYRDLFDWTVSEGPDPGYRLVDTGAADEAIGRGIGAAQGPDDPGAVTIYRRVDDPQGYLDKAERLGRKTAVPPSDLPGEFGRFALFADPDDHTVGLCS